MHKGASMAFENYSSTSRACPPSNLTHTSTDKATTTRHNMTQQPPPAQAPIGCMMPLQAYLEERNQHLCQQYGAYPQLQRHQGFQYNATTTPHNMSQLPTDASPVGCMKPLEAFIQHLRQKNGAQPKPLQHQGFQYNPQAHAFLSYPALWEWDSFAYSKNAAYSYIPVLAANGYQVQAQSAPVNPATPAAAMYQAWPSQQHYGQGGYSARPGAQQQQGLTSQPFPDPHVYQKPRHMPSPFPGSERFRPAYMAGHISQPAPSQPLTGAPLGPPDRRQYGPSHAMQPLSLFVQQMPAYDREYPASPGFSRLHQAPQQATSFGPRHVLGVHPQQAASFVPPHRKPFGQDVASQNESQELTEKENASPTSFVAGVPVSNGEGAHYGRNTIDLLAASTGEGDHYEMNTEDLLASSTQHMVDSDGQHPEAPTLSKPPSATVAVTTFTQDVDSDTKSAPTPDTIRGRRKDPHTNELIRQLEQPFASKADMWHSVSPVEPQVADDQPENAVEYESPPQQQSSSLESLKKEQPEQTAAKERNKRNRNRNRNNRRWVLRVLSAVVHGTNVCTGTCRTTLPTTIARRPTPQHHRRLTSA
ncbi:hypothetical protein EJ02DRAFT_52528 [Clathrospora elynae]|uniref:Uncharacterized protein n=1 Tax=Clathrospora elynae TaxID=706981 RepID=A0A6A5SXB3_9PLEO|nr:hypothetical protein EJ02DRAFT_52528 [Clathrospora elynae]